MMVRILCNMLSCLAFSVTMISNLYAGSTDLLQPGDVLQLSVYNHEELSISCRVETDGKIRVPLASEVPAAGRTTSQVASDLTRRFETANIADGFVSVFVSSYAPRTVYVLGQVKEGGIQLHLPVQGEMTALQAISSVGGFLETADLRRVTVRRKSSKQNVNERYIAVNAAALLNSQAGIKDVVLQPGDTIVVPRAKPVSVFGMVAKAGTFFIDTSLAVTAAELISQAGGLKEDAASRQVLLMRADATGKRTVIHLDMAAVMSGERLQGTPVQPGDLIIVQAQDNIFVFGEVGKPGAIALKPGIELTATKAISMAAGFTRNANKGKVLLVRKGEIIKLDLKNVFDGTTELEQDRRIQPGDILFVQESIW